MRIRSRVKVDADNVCNNMVLVMYELYEERTGIRLNYEDTTCYDFSGIGSKEVIADLYSMFGDKEMWDRLEPPPNAQKYLKKLCDGFDTRIVTATDARNFAWKVDWFARFYPWIPSGHIVCLHDKQWLMTDYAIDDYQENLKGDAAHRILIDSPWNRAERDDVFGFIRVKDLEEAYENICQIEEQEKGW